MRTLRLKSHLILWAAGFAILPAALVLGYHFLLADPRHLAEHVQAGLGAEFWINAVVFFAAVVAACIAAELATSPFEKLRGGIEALAENRPVNLPNLSAIHPLEAHLLAEQLRGAIWHQRQLRSLSRIDRITIDTQSIKETSDSLVNEASRLFDAEHVDLVVRNGNLHVYAGTLPAEVQERLRRLERPRLGEGAAGSALLNRSTTIVQDARTDPRYESLRWLVDAVGYRTVVATPLLFQPHTEAALTLGYSTVRDLHPTFIRGLERFCAQASVALLSAQRLERLKSFAVETATALAQVVELRDPYTSGHCKRIRELALSLGRHLGLDHAELENLGMAALLHDIGKVAVPAAVLNKPAPLDSQEMAIVRHHAADGASVLSKVEALVPIAPLVRHHQEHWDGNGYPDGLAREEIPLGARILAVVDAYDAMTSDRPYRTALPEAIARQELVAGAGTQFDPEVVSAVLEVLDEEDRKKEASQPVLRLAEQTA